MKAITSTMDVGNLFYTIVPICLLFGLSVFARLQFKSWLAPSAFFGVFWTVALAGPLIFAPQFSFWFGAAWWVLAFCCVLYVGTVFGWIIGGKQASRGRHVPRHHFLFGKEILVICTLLGLGAIFVILRSRGYGFGSLLSPSRVAAIARDFSVARYHQAYKVPVTGRLFTAFIYLGTILAGIWLAIARRKQKWWAGLPFIPAVLRALILTQRANFLLPIILCLSGYFAATVLKASPFRLGTGETSRFLAVFILVCLVSLGLIVGLQSLRDRAFTAHQFATTLYKVRSSLLGSPPAFSLWLAEVQLRRPEPTWGAFSFAGLFDLLGLSTRQLGLYTDFVLFGTYGQTNIYTVFRGLVQDFTLLGANAIFFVLGLWVGIAYYRVWHGEQSWIGSLILFYTFTLWGYVACILMENTFLLIFLLLPIVFSRKGLNLLREMPPSRPT